MSLPISANRTPTTSARVARADILAIQDCQVARYRRGISVQRAITIPALAGRGGAGASWIPNTSMYREANGASGTLILPLALPVGTRFFQVAARVFGGGGSNIAIGVYRRQHGSSTPAASVYTATGASSGAWTTLANSANAIGHIMEEGWRYWIRVTSGQSGDRCLWGRLVIDRP